MIIDKLNKSEIKVLKTLQEKNIFNETASIKISKLSELTGLSYYSVRNIIKSFYVAEICCKGRRDGNSETYYLSEKGQKISLNKEGLKKNLKGVKEK